MDEKKVREISQKVFYENTRANQYRVSPIAAHAHNGTDSLQVNPNDLVNASLYFAVTQIILSSGQIKFLNSSPITLVPSFGVNTVIIVEGITAKLYYGGTAYTGANNLEFRYTDGSGTKVTADMANSFINSSADAYRHVAGITTDFTPVSNAPIVVRVPTANPGTGNSQIVFFVKYRVIPI